MMGTGKRFASRAAIAGFAFACLLAACRGGGLKEPERPDGVSDPGPSPAGEPCADAAGAAEITDPAQPQEAEINDAVQAGTEGMTKTEKQPGGAAKVKTVSAGGSAVVAISGCLKAAKDVEGEKAGDMFPVPKKRSGGSKDDITVKPASGGAVVVHKLAHACCLKGTVKTNIKGDKVAVMVDLTGKACRCMCSSTIKTTLSLSPGTYSVAVYVNDQGTGRKAAEKSVTVQEQKKTGAPAREGKQGKGEVKTLKDKFGAKGN
jgi:hypothetical protein